MALPRVVLRLAYIAILATKCHAYPACYACGCEKCEVGYPRGIISIPSALQDSLGNLETITCFQFNQAGMGGLLPESICELNRLATSRSACDCPGGGIVVEEETDAPTTIAFDEIEPTGAPTQVEHPLSDSPSAVPHAITAHAPVAPVVAPIVPTAESSSSNKKTSTKTSVSATSKKSTKKDQSTTSKASTGTESEQKSKQPKGSSNHLKTENKTKKERTKKKVSTKLVK